MPWTWRELLGLRAWLWLCCIAGELASSVRRLAVAIQGRADLAMEEVAMVRGVARSAVVRRRVRALERRWRAGWPAEGF